MCGITGYIGPKEALPIVFSNLRKLEYRGYDSAGAAFFRTAENLSVIKAAGKIENLESKIWGLYSVAATAAIAHTRWATHGAPTEANAHPHIDCSGAVALVHNGIIENYRELKTTLEKSGHIFKSETDTEVVSHLIEEKLKKSKKFEFAFAAALRDIRGAYAFAVISVAEPDVIYFARLGSPLVLGFGKKNEFYLASDPTALAGLVKKVMYLDEGARGKISPRGLTVSSLRPKIEPLELCATDVSRGSFPHFMLKEIFEGPEVVREAMRGRLRMRGSCVKLGGLEAVREQILMTKRFNILACGTSYYAGLVGKLLFEELAQLPAEVALASEFRYNSTPDIFGAAGIFISQSGETADTLAALRKMAAQQSLTLGVVNVPGSSIARETIAGVYNRAGVEIGVASTKAFLSQLTVLTLMSLYLSQKNVRHRKIKSALLEVPKKIETILAENNKIRVLAKKYEKYRNFLYIGRGYNYPAALEGALKLKEIAYVHAEGYAGGEMKHGPLALVDKNLPIVAIAPQNALYEKMISNLHEIKARGGKIIAIATAGDKGIQKIADDVIYIPATEATLEPMLSVVPLQLFAYHSAVLRGRNVDKPRNLAKSVTVE